MLQLIRNHPGLLITLILLAGGLLVCLLMAFILSRAGASVRPILWFAGFFALVVVPQVLGHLYKALQTTRLAVPSAVVLDPSPISTSTGANAVVPNKEVSVWFGPDADPQLITDVRQAYGEIFEDAELAQFAVLPNGETVLLARFRSSSAAEKAWVKYLRVSGLNQMGGKGDSQRGYAVTRPVGDRAYALHFGGMLGIWTGQDDQAIRQRMMAGGFEIPRRAPLGEATEMEVGTVDQGSQAAGQGSRLLRTILLGIVLAAYLLVVVFYFFKGAAWAGSTPAKPGSRVMSASELAGRLESINALDVPFRVERGERPGEYFATWRYADAKWVDLARARGMTRAHRIRLALDEKNRTLRATDYFTNFDWSAGRGGANLDWKAGLGIVFFQYQHQRVFGLQLDEKGDFKPELGYAYTFNLNEMKSPLVEAVTSAGWTWRPSIWQGPAWLRWLTE